MPNSPPGWGDQPSFHTYTQSFKETNATTHKFKAKFLINWPMEAHECGCWPEAIGTDWWWYYVKSVWGKQGKHRFCDDPGTAHSAGPQPALPWSHRLSTQKCLEFTIFRIGLFKQLKQICKSGSSNFKSTHGCRGQSQLGLPQRVALHLSFSSPSAEAGHQDLQPLRADNQWAYLNPFTKAQPDGLTCQNDVM